VANPQVENGHTDIAHEVLEAIVRSEFTGYDLRVLFAVARLTWGWHKKEDTISLRQIAEMTKIDRRHVHRTLKNLSSRMVIAVTTHGDRRAVTYRIQKDYEQWLSPRMVTGSVTADGDRSVTADGTIQRKERKKDRRAQENRTRSPKTPKPKDPDIRVFLDRYHDAFLAKFGEKPNIQGGKDASIVGGLLSKYGIDRLSQLLDAFFASNDEFIARTGYTLGAFSACINKLISQSRSSRDDSWRPL
jgi:phage replication O-like protein O